MPRISNLTSLTTADDSDQLAIVDTSASVTKKITRGDLLKGPFPANSVTTPAITDASVTAQKIDFTTLLLGSHIRITDFSTTGTNTQITGASISVTITTGMKIKITVSGPVASNTNSPSNTGVSIWDGTPGSGTQVGFNQITSGGANYGSPVNIVVILSPTAGVHTYNLALSNIGGGTSTIYSTNGTRPLTFLIERVG